jgi:hypothetical protein
MMPESLRILPSEIGPVIPVVDIEGLLGYSRSAINKVLKEHEGKMTPCKTFLPLPTVRGSQQFLCLNREGVDNLLLLIHPSKSRMTAEGFLEFRRDLLNKMGEPKSVALTTTEAAPVPATTTLDSEILHARKLAEKCGKNPDAFLAIALEKCGDGDYARALQAPALVHGEPGWHNVTQLVALCNDPLLNPERLNYFLMNRGFQYRDENRLWRLTPSGIEHGREYLYTSPHQHSEIRISWRESVLYASGLKRPLSVSQAQLSAKV